MKELIELANIFRANALSAKDKAIEFDKKGMKLDVIVLSAVSNTWNDAADIVMRAVQPENGNKDGTTNVTN